MGSGRRDLLFAGGISTRLTYLSRGRISIRFQPKRRASIDHGPGPSSARAAPRVPSRAKIHGSPTCKKIFHSSMTATSVPATRVQKPASKSIPAPIASTDKIASRVGGPLHSLMTPRSINAIPATSRMSRRPKPDGPL